ncbi:MAG: FAD:protein FMN transferase [Caulobacteraceae bacterium]|nr:FAD:protein FMN transferase [Caulobacteraceae bacterium]
MRLASIERARPLLGTLVSVRVVAPHEALGHGAIDAAFAEIEAVHRLMSFHDPDSDLSRLHSAPSGQPTRVDARTAEVLAFALDLAARTGGIFDPTVGAAAVAAGALPRPLDAVDPAAGADWRDIRLEGDQVALNRPVWIDLGGVAKGYAADRALSRLRALGALGGLVNAGGDIALFGDEPEPVRLRAGPPDQAAFLELDNGALASSGADEGLTRTLRLDGRTGRAAPRERFACVLAETCMKADALTKVALAGDWGFVTAEGASGLSYDPTEGWRGYGSLT